MWLPATPMVLAALLVVSTALGGESFIDNNGYRYAHYRAPVPAHHPDAAVLDAGQLEELIAENDPVLLDVMPRVEPGHPHHLRGIPPNAPRVTLPASHWAPNVGYPALEPSLEEALRELLVELTDGNTARPVVVFCMTNCWMAWNAARRISRYGYESVYWYPGGADDWARQGRETAVRPVALGED